ncbi:FxLYD domain-containing protein [Halogeometricum sp. S1BR25-6]|uniref:FxLYD domain-containing protein n=1 Tax=Halogeometricum salsisoli TaxID=2950536 RepID=A0ABU2GEZ5_9EURY|nr:FxLYD domain-containing protein [Halogeometricum sp. S1BR25-6]MDS0299377.1 FxLYD domain-containing protein [Halogeometricum sp. S1BR25-6]
MRRRSYLALTVGIISISGCAGGTNNSDGATEGNENTETTQEESTSTQASEGGSASFEVIGVDAPDQVQAGEEHNFTVRIRNTGDQAGTFETTVELSTADATRWEEIGSFQIEDVAPGETGKFTSDDVSFDQAYQLQFRLVDYDTEWSYDVVVPQPDITIGETSLVEVDTGYETRPMAGVLVTNDGESPTKRLPVTVDWLNDAGEYLASSEGYVQTLGVGETWSARIDPSIDVDDYSVIDDFEVSVGNVALATTLDPDGVTLSGVELRSSESQVLVRGQVQNQRDGSLDYVEVVAKVYNPAGEVIGWERTNETDIGAGNVVRFELEPDTKGRDGDVETSEVVVSDSTLSL